MIKVNNLNKNFNSKKILIDINFSIAEQEIFGLVGADGSGKTTLLRIILGLMTANSGKVVFPNNASLEKMRKKFAYVPQLFSLYPNLTVLENIYLIASCYGLDNLEIKTAAIEILTFTDLLPFKDRFAGKLSGGMKQKLALATALIHKPKYIFLDEPTTGVDPVSRREFWQLLHTINRAGTTIIVSTPYMDEAEFCHKIAFISSGQVNNCDTPANLIAAYPYRLLELQLLGELPNFKLLLPEVIDISIFGTSYHIALNSELEKATEDILTICQNCNCKIISLKPIPPNLEDIFIYLSKIERREILCTY